MNDTSPEEQLIQSMPPGEGEKALRRKEYDWTSVEFQEAVLDWVEGDPSALLALAARRGEAAARVTESLRKAADYKAGRISADGKAKGK